MSKKSKLLIGKLLNQFLKFFLFSLNIILFSCDNTIYLPEDSITSSSEAELCLTSFDYSSPVVVSGTARFFKRRIDVSSSSGSVTSLVLGAPTSSALPIKFAEISIKNQQGDIVQCGRTNQYGELKAIDGTSDLTLSATSAAYTLSVGARTQYTFPASGSKPSFELNTSVKKDIYDNEFYKISSSISTSGTGTVSSSLIAYARESESSEITGGAFNIYNNAISAYEYLFNNTESADLKCLNKKIHFYWKAGYNPAQYLYPDENPSDLSNISFYLKGDHEVYVNGGSQGNVDVSDTDHFDDSVILHELGHYLEDACGNPSSPGGQHNGHFRIDPRLAWSEGWGNFFSAHILKNSISNINPELSTSLSSLGGWLYYLDTKGYNEGLNLGGSQLIRFNLSKSGASPDSSGSYYYDKVNSTENPGEGHFREVSISRSLFKSTNTCSGTCSNTDYFSKIWQAFINDSNSSLANPFFSSMQFYEKLKSKFSGQLPTSVKNIIETDEAQQLIGDPAYKSNGYLTWPPYAIPLMRSSSSCLLKIEPRAHALESTNSLSDQRFSNHFYTIKTKDLRNITSIQLQASHDSGESFDIDLILYDSSYKFIEDICNSTDSNNLCLYYSKRFKSDEFIKTDRSHLLTKNISGLNQLGADSYLNLNIRAHIEDSEFNNSSSYTYVLKDNKGEYLCPAENY